MLKYVRFLIPLVAMCLSVAYVLPVAGVTLTPGFQGFLAAMGVGTVLFGVFYVFRLLETWVINKIGGDTANRRGNTVLALSGFFIVLTGLALFGISQLLPTVVVMASFTNALIGGFWLTAVGMLVSPSPALTSVVSPVQPLPPPAPPVPTPSVTDDVAAKPGEEVSHQSELATGDDAAQAAERSRQAGETGEPNQS